MQDLNDLYFYVQIVDHGGFAPAGRALGLPKSTLSRRLAALEERLGVRLIQRSTRRFTITEIGQTYYEHCKAMLVEAEAAQAAIELTRAEPRGVVRISCPITLLNAHVSDMLADFMVSYPHVTVQLDATNRRVDLIGEALDIAIRVRPPPLQDSDLVMRVLSDRSQCLIASPALIERHGMPGSPADLGGLPQPGFGPASAKPYLDLVRPRRGPSHAASHAPADHHRYDCPTRSGPGRCGCSAITDLGGVRSTGRGLAGQTDPQLGPAARDHPCRFFLPPRPNACRAGTAGLSARALSSNG